MGRQHWLGRRRFLRTLLAYGAAAPAACAERRGRRPIYLGGQACQVLIAPIAPGCVRILVQPAAAPAAKPQHATLGDHQWPGPLRLTRLRPGHTLHVAGLRLACVTSPLSIMIYRGSRLVQTIRFSDAGGRVEFHLGAGPLFGLGEGGRQYNRRGGAYRFRHGQGLPDLRQVGARLPVPWLVSLAGWAIFFGGRAGRLDLRKSTGRWTTSPASPIDLFVAAAAAPAELFRAYARICGAPMLPPIWALGYQQSHRTLAGPHSILAEAAEFRAKRLPCDVMIYLGTGFCPSGWNLGHGSYTFNPRNFPHPRQMIAALHNLHFRVVLHEDKPPPHLHGRATDQGAAAANPDDAAFYWRKHLPLVRLGVDGWWADEGDWLSPRESLVRNRMYYDGSLQACPNVRPYTLSRNGSAGTQRYSFVWSGDIDSAWDTLRAQVANGLNAAASGLPWWGTDTGGFITTPQLDGELFVRWFQFSTFCPLFRCHGRTWHLRLPWGWNTGHYGPVEDPRKQLPPRADLHNAAVEPCCRAMLNLRYRLLPYTYTLARECHDTGLPLMRPMWLACPRDPTLAQLAGQYMWGGDLLVAPVLEKSATMKTVHLPAGHWYDFHTGHRYAGNATIHYPVQLPTLPLFVRAGAILPTGPLRQYATEPITEPLTLTIYPGADGRASLYLDDGTSMEYATGSYAYINFTWNDSLHRLQLALRPASKARAFLPQRFTVRTAGAAHREDATFTGDFLEMVVRPPHATHRPGPSS